MTEYFKLVRPDYKSFYDETFQWALHGIVEVIDAASDGPCGKGLHLAKTIEGGLKYAKFPFRVLKVVPLSPVLGGDEDKIRVAKAESFGELPVPEWAVILEKKIKKIQEDVKIIPWFKGTDEKKAKTLIRTHFKLLVPFGFKLDFDIEILKSWDAARTAARTAAWTAAWTVAWAAAWTAAGDAAWTAAGDAARTAARTAAGDAAEDAAWTAARTVAGDAAEDAAWTAARTVAWAAAWTAAGDAAWTAAGDAARTAARTAAGDAAEDAARTAARTAAGDAAWTAAWALLKQKNPFTFLWEVHKLGFWPIGFNGKKFMLFSEKAK